MIPKINVPSGTKLAVVGDIHEHEEQFDKLMDLLNPSDKMFFVSVGDIYDKGFGISHAESITDKIRYMAHQGYGFVVEGNHEVKHIKKARKTNTLTAQLAWLEQQPLAMSFVFDNGFTVMVVHGGITPDHTLLNIERDINVVYIRDLDEAGKAIKLKWVEVNGIRSLRPAKEGGRPWHESYDGRFGYIVSGHDPLKDGKPKFYQNSCNLDTACYCTGILTCQTFTENGLDVLHSVEGASKRWREEED